MSHRTARHAAMPFAIGFVALSVSAFSVGCGGSIAPTLETEAVPSATPASVEATLFAHFPDAPSAIFLGRDYVYVATKTSVLSGVRSSNGALWAVSKGTGERHQLWVDRLGAAPVAMARSGRELVLAMNDGRILALPETGGDSRLAARVDGTPSHLVATTSEAVVRLSENPSLLVSVGLGNGTIRTRFTPGSQVVSLAAEGETVFVGMKTQTGGSVLRLAATEAEQERALEIPAAPCGMAASPTGLVVADGTKTLRYWNGSAAPSAFNSDLTSTCTVTLTQDRVFWASASPKTRALSNASEQANAGGTVLLSRALDDRAPRITPAPAGAADWMTTDLPTITQAESDQENVYVLSADDVVRIARPRAN